MTIAQDFIKKLQDVTGKEPLPQKFWEDYREEDKLTFQDVLNKYAQYYQELSSLQKKEMSKIFWEQVKALGGTPIIEDNLSSKGECDVYFLVQKDELAESIEAPGTKKDLYLQGDFHGYGSIDGRQELLELPDTGIMWHKDTMPRDSLVVYSYIEVEPSHRGIKPEPELPPFFEDGDGFTPRTTNTAIFPEISSITYIDKYSTHTSPYFFDSPEKIVRINSDPERAHIPGKQVDWPILLNTQPHNDAKHFAYHTTLYSDQNGDLHRSNAPVTEQYHDDLFYSNGYNLSLKAVPSFNELDTSTLGETPYLIKGEEEGEYKIWGYKEDRWQLTDLELTDVDSLNIPPKWKPDQAVFVSITDAHFNTLKRYHTPYLPYANFTRAIQVFKPASGQIDNIIVINDGVPSLITGRMDHFEKMVAEQKLSPNTAFVFINPLPGLEQTLSSKDAAAFNADPSKDLDGMGFRLIDYKHGIDQYIDFIDQKLFPELQKEIDVPSDPSHRVIIGSSLSGTASIYIGSQRPDLFGAVIAQSPSPDNRAILSNIPRAKLTGRNIYLSCGEFEHPDYAAANANVEYAKELAHKLDVSLHIGAHGHQFIAWNEELEEAISATALQRVIDSAHTPAVSYACVLPNADETQFTPMSITVGKKSAQPVGSETSAVNDNTRFPASSLSKIVFTYLVLQLAKDNIIDLDTPLYDILGDDEKFEYERLKVNGEYPERAKLITARDVLSHTTGLPNVEPDSPLPLTIDTKSELGEGYSYSGEAFLYLQKALEAKTGQDLETLAKKYVFTPLHMERSTFLPQPQDDPNIVKVHSETGVATVINETRPELNEANAAGSLLTTADDFSKLMVAWLEDMENPKDSITRQAFKPTNEEDFMTRGTRTCGLGWHIYKNKDEVIAYQYGENFNTRSFIAINVNDKKGAVFFTNSINGSSIANQILNSSDLPAIGDLQDVYKDLRYRQSDVPGSEEAKVATIAGKNAEEVGQFDEARRCFEEALKWTPQDVTTQNRLEWFNKAHPSNAERQIFTEPSEETFVGEFTNKYGDHVAISTGEFGLMYKKNGRDTKLVRISETDFVPETDQLFKIYIDGNKMSIFSIEGDEYELSRTLTKSNVTQDTIGSDVAINDTITAGTTEPPKVSVAKSSEQVTMNPSTKDVEAAQKTIKQFKDALPQAPSIDNTENPAKNDDDSSFTV